MNPKTKEVIDQIEKILLDSGLELDVTHSIRLIPTKNEIPEVKPVDTPVAGAKTETKEE